MTGRAMSLIAAARRALLAQPGVRTVRIVRDARRAEVPLAQQSAHLLEPVASETAHWPESADWRYEVAVFRLASLARGRPGTAAHHALADLHQAALETLRTDADLLDQVADGPPVRTAGLADRIGGVRCGTSQVEQSRPGDPLVLATTVALCRPVEEPAEFATLDGEALFAGGPHEVLPGTPERAAGERLFNALRGALLVDLGARPRQLVQRGRLSAASAISLAQLESAIEARIDGEVHSLVARDGTQYPCVRLEKFTRRGPVQAGLRRHRAYEIVYTEFPAE